MEKYYFMNKKEVLEPEEYENLNKQIVFHYDREKLSSKRLHTPTKEIPSLLSFVGKKTRSRKLIHALNIIVLLGLFFYWYDYYKERKEISSYQEGNSLIYELKTFSINDKEKEAVIYIKNIQPNALNINKSFNVKFLFITEKKTLLSKELNFLFYKDFKPDEVISLCSIRLDNEQLKSIIKIKAVINNDISLTKILGDKMEEK